MPARAAILAGSIEAGGEDAFFGQTRERLKMDFPGPGPLHAFSGSGIMTDARATRLELLKPSGGRFFHFITEARSLGVGAQR
jgi:hypothetical protein